jgi:DNA-binding YbaB/EbfC family protein
MAYGGKMGNMGNIMGNMGNMGNMNKMMKQVQKMQADVSRMQEQLKDILVEATAGGGAVRIVMNCKQEVKSLHVDPEILVPEDVDMLQDLLMAAFNEGVRQSQERSGEEMNKITGGLNVPGLF